MAEDLLGKTVKRLKIERTTAKASFTRHANFLSREAESMIEADLKEEFNKLSIHLKEVYEANDDYRAGLLAETTKEEEEEEPLLGEQQEADLEKTASDVESRFKKVRDIVQSNLWLRYGQEEVTTAVLEAEKNGEVAGDFPVQSTHLEGFEVHLNLMEKRIKDACSILSAWERWIPGEEKRDLDGRIKILKATRNRLELRKVEYATTRRIAEESQASGGRQSVPLPATPIVRIKPTALPTFNGNRREYYRWKKDWVSLQKQGEPSGSAEVKKIQLMTSIEEKISINLRLSTYSTAEEVFRVLDNRYGNTSTITIEILEELEKLPPVRGNQPRRVIELIQTIEKALADLTELGNSGAMKNLLVVKAIESKLPDFIKKDWLIFMLEPSNDVTPENHFDALLKFLKKQEGMLERLEQLKGGEKIEMSDYQTGKRHEKKYATTRAAKKEMENCCVVCGDERHHNKIFFCKKFKTLDLHDKTAVLKRIKACRRCLGCHEEDDYCRDTYLCRNRDCNRDGSPNHHYFLCPVGNARRNKQGDRSTKQESSPVKTSLTSEQQEFLSKLSPEMAEKCKRAFTNNNASASTSKTESALLKRNGLCELPVIMMLMEVTANAGQKIGTLIDLASDTNYITHKAADRLRLQSEKVTLVVHGVGRMIMKVNTRRYILRVRVRTPNGGEKAHELVCYGLEEIANVHKGVEAEQLQKFFPEVRLEEMRRPTNIELLISHREGRLAPQRAKVVGDLVLWESPLGKTVGGAHPDLFENIELAAYTSKTHFARSMRTAAVKYEELTNVPAPEKTLQKCQHLTDATKFTANSTRDFLDWWRWESIGAACEPKCGGCRCGKCQPGGKEMTLAEERELEIIKQGLTYITEDAHAASPHWDAKYPWTEDPASLPNNKAAVMATFLRTERRLQKDPEWQVAYASQIHDMIERGAAVELTTDMKRIWKGPVWYVSHLIAPNPHSVTTPVRLVWNSSQRFRGLSMNDLLLKGPDVLNPIRAVLLKFRSGVYAALGDIKKMYNSVWLEEREMHLHRFLWRDSDNEEMREYVITRVNMGDRPAGCIAQLAMRETARLPHFAHLQEERRVVEEDSYVDDILTSHNSLEGLDKITQGVKEILAAGGFFLKPWIMSGQSGRQKIAVRALKGKEPEGKTIILPNQMRDDDNKALGVGYLAEEDVLYVLTSVNFSKRRKKMRLGKNLLKEEVGPETPNPLTRRVLLSQVAGLYDPMGFAAPVKQRGAILVRKAFQEGGGGKRTRETWDSPLSDNLREEAIQLFEDYVELRQIKFCRSLTPAGWKGRPWGITFSDGSDKSYGAVMYLRWETTQGADVRFVEAKAKLTPLDQKGEAVKAEMCGAVFASRLRKYFERHGNIEMGRWIHLLDSQTVLGAIQRDSYGYQTFFANRVGEIQRTGPVEDWLWIPGGNNVADIITRGGKLEDLEEDAVWQNGPEFLKWPVEDWPVKSAGEVVARARESVNRLQKKAFTSAVTRSQTKETKVKPESTTSPTALEGRAPAGKVVKTLVKVENFSSLPKLVDTIAWVWRAAKQWLKLRHKGSRQVGCNRAVLAVRERTDALRDLFLSVQQDTSFPNTALNRLAVYRDVESGLLVCGGRIQVLEDEKAIPILPHNSWVSTLVVREAHKANHEGVAGTLLKTRKTAWIVKGRRLARKVVDSCVICRKIRAKHCKQVMSDLPPERSSPANPFEFTTMDLFGPYEVKDEVKKRVKLKIWGIVFCCMASRAVHTDITSDQSSEGFLLAYQRFTALRGHPRKLWSDPGTNFVGAKPALEDLHRYLEKIDKSEVEDRASKHGTEWSWKIHPAASPHRNRAAEAAVKVVKRALSNLGGDGIFTWGEFQTFLFMAANLVNERPIDARAQCQEDSIGYISPNSLLLGRTGTGGDPGNFQFENYPYKRLRTIQEEVSKFWKKWSELAGPNLFIRSKWHTKERNVAVGDVVWLADQNSLRGQYKLGRVVSVNTDNKGIVRDANVRTSPSCPVSTKTHGPRKDCMKPPGRIPSTVLHRDVRRLVILLPIEEQCDL